MALDSRSISRRDFHRLVGATTVVAAVPGILQASAARTPEMFALPSVEVIAAHRLACGFSAATLSEIQKMGLEKWLNWQLKPTTEDPKVDAKLKAQLIHVEYEYEEKKEKKKVKEDRPLKYLDAKAEDLWKLIGPEFQNRYNEKILPVQEVQLATIIRAVYSQWQLREVMADFWHNHFNVNAFVDDEKCRIMFPVYDRDVIRKNCFGNFRQMLESVTKSHSMLVYLNNYRSKASPANENFARELFELHTLGAKHYLNDKYKTWRDVPGAKDGKAVGYIDQDVYEAARAFTGWTIADGEWTGRGEEWLPKTGKFHFEEAWHDNYQKRVLGKEFEPNNPPMQDGLMVLDLVARHPGTADHICTKLVRRLVADDPPTSLVEKAKKVWLANIESSDQIAKTIQAIVLSPEFAKTYGQKIKRPMELIASYIKGTEADFFPRLDLVYYLETMGQKLFTWPTPTGHPDVATHWTGTTQWAQRWNTPYGLFWDGSHLTKFPDKAPLPASLEALDIVDHVSKRMLGFTLSDKIRTAFADLLTKDRNGAPWKADDPELHKRFHYLEIMVSLTPEFQVK